MIKVKSLKSKVNGLLPLVFCLLPLSEIKADGRGVPFFRNFSSKEYMAHNRNYDIACDDYGTVFVANFEGLLYYDGATWRKIHTPGISRVTRLTRGDNGRIWVGGYNVFGYLKSDKLGRIQIHTIVSDADRGAISEVDNIKVENGKVYVHTTADKTYEVIGDNALKEQAQGKDTILTNNTDSVSLLKMPHDIKLRYSHTYGIDFGKSRYAFAPLSETDGLISNAINRAVSNRTHMVWGATDNGIFAVEALSPYGQIGEKEGLKGEVNCIGQLAGTYYIGTMKGLYRLNGNRIQMVADIDLACWQLTRVSDGKMLAATSQGLYLITPNGIQHITGDNTFSVCHNVKQDGYITGEVDGVYYVSALGKKTMVLPLEKVTKIHYANKKFTVESIYGEQWELSFSNSNGGIKVSDRCIRQSADVKDPKLKYTDPSGTLWTTDPEGRNLRASTTNKQSATLSPWMYPFTKRALNCLYASEDGKMWAGGDFGVIILDTRMVKELKQQPILRPYIR